MTDPGRGAVRVLRALVLLATVTGLVLAAHVLGGGRVGAVPAAGLAALLWPACLLVSRRRVGLPTLVAGLAAGQTVGHVLLTHLAPVGHGAGSGCLSGSAAAHATHGAHVAHQLLAACHAGAVPADMAAGMSIVPSAGMLLGHLLATALTAVLLARGEAVLWRLVDLVLRPVPHLLPLRDGTVGLGGAPAAARRRGAVPVPQGRGPPVLV